jgi:hypothetical protein
MQCTLEAKIQHGFKISRKNHEQNPYHRILIDGILREIISPKGKSSHFFYKIVWHIFLSQMVKEWNVGVFPPWNNFWKVKDALSTCKTINFSTK